MYVERIAAYHDRESFTCGEHEVDDFLYVEALNENYGSTWVVVPENGSSQVIAYYTIDPEPIIGIEDEYGEHPVGFVEIRMLGVDVNYQKQGIGERLLMRVIKQVLRVSSVLSINALLLTALNEKAKNWYLGRNFGFQEAAPGSMHLLLPVATMLQLPGAADLRLPPEGF